LKNCKFHFEKVVVTVTTTFKSGGDKSLSSHTKLRLWQREPSDILHAVREDDFRLAHVLCFYKSLMRPNFEFCTSPWSPYYETDKQLIEKKIQRRFTSLAKLKLWSLEDRRIRADFDRGIQNSLWFIITVKLEAFFEVDYGSRTRGHDWN